MTGISRRRCLLGKGRAVSTSRCRVSGRQALLHWEQGKTEALGQNEQEVHGTAEAGIEGANTENIYWTPDTA